MALEKEKEDILKSEASAIGNIVHQSVPTSMDEENNEIFKTWEPADKEGEHVNKPVKKNDILSHNDVLHRIDGYDAERGM